MAVMLDKMGAMMVLPLLPFIARSNLVKANCFCVREWNAYIKEAGCTIRIHHI